MHVRAVLKSITQLTGGQAVATVQLTGLGNFETYHDGYAVSHAIPRELLTPGADIVIDLPDAHHPGDGQVVSVAQVSAGSSGVQVEQFGNVLVTTDSAGNGSASVVFPNTYGSFSAAPSIALSAPAQQLGSGTLAAAAITTAGFTLNVSAAATVSGSIPLAWDASGT